MSDIILGKQGIDPRVVKLATQIKATQGSEVQQMQSWLSQWGQPTISMAPGMMSDQDMAALQNAQGVDASKPGDHHHARHFGLAVGTMVAGHS